MFSIIIPTYNRNDLLSSCLVALHPSVQDSTDQYRVIVSDDSSDNKAKMLIDSKFPWVTCVIGPQKGPAANRNNGAKSAIGEWLVFIDDDCVPEPALISSYSEAVKGNDKVKVYEGCIRADRKQMSFLEESPVNEKGGYLWSCNFMINKDFFNQLGGFDETFPFAAMEDVDLHYRIQKAHEPILFVKKALVIHPWRQQKDLIGITQKRFKSWIHFINKHPERNQHKSIVDHTRDVARFLLKRVLLNLPKLGFRGAGTYMKSYFLEMWLNIKYERQSKGK